MYGKEDKSWTTRVYEVDSHAVNKVPLDPCLTNLDVVNAPPSLFLCGKSSSSGQFSY